MRKTKIVATIGPTSDSEEMLEKLFLAGVNVARMNFSHGTHESHGKVIDRIKKIRKKHNLPIPIMLDTKGPEIRTGDVEGKIFLEKGDLFSLYFDDRMGSKEGMSVSYKDLWRDLSLDEIILIDDGAVGFQILSIDPDEIQMKALNEGVLSSHKGVNIPGAKINLPTLTQKDIDDILFGIEKGVDFIAASFIRKKEDVLVIRQLLEDNGGDHIQIIAKIENKEGIDNLPEIIPLTHGIMVARGDMGVEIEPERIALVQKEMIACCNQEGIPSITATQMLDSMIRNPRPTRAEVTDVSNAILDGTSAIMLSGETASGKYPVEAVEMMNRIALVTEASMEYREGAESNRRNYRLSTTNTIAKNACDIAAELSAAALVIATRSGYSARMVAKFQPQNPIIAVTPDEGIYRQMNLLWGVCPLHSSEEVRDLVEDTLSSVRSHNLVQEGDLVVFVGGIPLGRTGSTNFIKVHQMAKVIGVGQGITRKKVTGKVLIAREGESTLRDFEEGDILLIKNFHNEYLHLLTKSGGLISEEEGFTSPSAIASIELDKPAIIGVSRFSDNIREGQIITMDCESGEIFIGNIQIPSL